MALNYLVTEQKHNLFGRIQCVPAPTDGNKEGIRITNNWQKEHLENVDVPQLAALFAKNPKGGFPKDGRVLWNKAGKEALLVLFREFERLNLLRHILTWAGAWAPRYIRGSTSVLSSHAWATAFDINAQWNGLGQTPAAAGQKGCILELVPVAEECGFYWGGNFPRKDGMHFELANPEVWVFVERT